LVDCIDELSFLSKEQKEMVRARLVGPATTANLEAFHMRECAVRAVFQKAENMISDQQKVIEKYQRSYAGKVDIEQLGKVLDAHHAEAKRNIISFIKMTN